MPEITKKGDLCSAINLRMLKGKINNNYVKGDNQRYLANMYVKGDNQRYLANKSVKGDNQRYLANMYVKGTINDI